LVAQALAASPLRPAILMVAGSREAAGLSLPPGVDCVTLPALRKDEYGQYRARTLDLSLDELIALRKRTIHATLAAFEPDLLIVDNVPRGAVGELDQSLAWLRARGRTRCVLGLRDILDEPVAVRREWLHSGNERTIRDYYDAVWVYGDPAVYNVAREYRLSADIAEMLRYTGYLDQRARPALAGEAASFASLASSEDKLVLCVVGGGQDGGRLAQAFAEADFPGGTVGVILTGPYMPPHTQQLLRRRASHNPQLRVLEHVREPAPLLRRADRVIAMGGYNTVSEVLSYEKKALIVPRVTPRREQLLRAERLQSLGLLDVLHPDALTPHALTEWLASAGAAHAPSRAHVDLGGLTRLPRLAGELLAAPAERLLARAAL
jgi:predicted glycosyltransferase